LLLMVVAHRDTGACSVPVITMVVLRLRIVMVHECSRMIGARGLRAVLVQVQAQVAGQGQVDLCLGRRWGGVAWRVRPGPGLHHRWRRRLVAGVRRGQDRQRGPGLGPGVRPEAAAVRVEVAGVAAVSELAGDGAAAEVAAVAAEELVDQLVLGVGRAPEGHRPG